MKVKTNTPPPKCSILLVFLGGLSLPKSTFRTWCPLPYASFWNFPIFRLVPFRKSTFLLISFLCLMLVKMALLHVESWLLSHTWGM